MIFHRLQDGFMLYAFDNAPLTTTDQRSPDEIDQTGEFNIIIGISLTLLLSQRRNLRRCSPDVPGGTASALILRHETYLRYPVVCLLTSVQVVTIHS